MSFTDFDTKRLLGNWTDDFSRALHQFDGQAGDDLGLIEAQGILQLIADLVGKCGAERR